MNVLVTGSNGFIGKNLIAKLNILDEDVKVLRHDIDNTDEELNDFINQADYIFHLAGVNRPINSEEFYIGNSDLTKTIVDAVELTNRNIPIVVSSSIHSEKDNDYGKSKKLAEDYLLAYSNRTGNQVNIYRLPNVFGKWSNPNYNSAIATFCYNIANDLPINVTDPNIELHLVYIDDVVDEMIQVFSSKENRQGDYCKVPVEHKATLGEITNLLYSYKESRKNRFVPNISSPFNKKLYSTYLSYLPKDEFSYNLKMNIDHRGSFTEFLKTESNGQVSINVSKPGITKGNHWHHTKNEKFLVVSGEGVIRFRNILNKEIIEYYVSGEELKVVDIPPGYTHNIENLGNTDMVTVMWANETFDPNNPDTIYEEV